MSRINPIPSGSQLESMRESSKPLTVPILPASWTAKILLFPFGDSIAPLKHYSQLAVATVETSATPTEGWMRVRLCLTRDRTHVDFIFLNFSDLEGSPRSEWYWINSTEREHIRKVFGPFATTLRIPAASFLTDHEAKWGNSYPLMCSNRNPKGIYCDHWVVPSSGDSDHGSWFAFRRDTGNLFRMFNMDSTNPQMVPILGSYYIANVESISPEVSKQSSELFTAIRQSKIATQSSYWNPMVTQEDIQRALASPLASTKCTAKHIRSIIPGFTAMPSGVKLPRWSDRTYIEGWTIGTDFIPYYTRVCYLWTDSNQSKQQTVFIGLGTTSATGTYLERTDTCLSTQNTDQPYFEWDPGINDWQLNRCLSSIPGVGLPFPDWLDRDGGKVVGQVVGNPNFGLGPREVLNFIAAELPRGHGELAIFWVWFLGNGDGMLFSEGNFLNPTSHNLQLIDYNLFLQNAPISSADFANPCKSEVPKTFAMRKNVHGHLMRVASRRRKHID